MMRVSLEIFEGPLDLLLYLIKREELAIYDIPIARLTQQYLEYLNLMKLLDLDLAGEFLVMAATLMQIKSKMLLPPDPQAESEEELDPRAELVRRLLEYKAYKEAAARLRDFEADRSRFLGRMGERPKDLDSAGPILEASLFDLLSALAGVLKGLPKESVHEVAPDTFTVADKIHQILHVLLEHPAITFGELFRSARNKDEVITAFLALLELIRLKEVQVKQAAAFGEIEISRDGAQRWNRMS